ncbi:hypothetical protein Tsubulata_039440 [Turnera subulata]|uniref:Uncharacterized protein n=1 Tax=Turnera subulata TaxID=218843 RepID=A0A9Q0FII8_9ROSI|nr:hypothetical protein Tsubulata_039440 [Turnera subulata]
MLGEGQFRRARKALIDVSVSMLDEKDSSSSSASSIAGHCNLSFGRQNPSKDHHHLAGHFRSLSWSVSRSWSTVRANKDGCRFCSEDEEYSEERWGPMAVAMNGSDAVLFGNGERHCINGSRRRRCVPVRGRWWTRRQR